MIKSKKTILPAPIRNEIRRLLALKCWKKIVERKKMKVKDQEQRKSRHQQAMSLQRKITDTIWLFYRWRERKIYAAKI